MLTSRVRPSATAAGATLMAVLSLLILPGSSRAQSGLRVELRGGVASAVEDLNRFTDPGGVVGVGIGWELTDRVSLWADGDVELMRGDETAGVALPSTALWHYHAALEVELLRSGTSPWSVGIKGGAGGTTFDTERFFEGSDDFIHTYFSTGGALEVGYRMSERFTLGVVGQAFVVFVDEADTEELADLAPTLAPFERSVSLPVQVFLRYTPR